MVLCTAVRRLAADAEVIGQRDCTTVLRMVFASRRPCRNVFGMKAGFSQCPRPVWCCDKPTRSFLQQWDNTKAMGCVDVPAPSPAPCHALQPPP